MLINQKKDLEDTNKTLSSKINKRCEHGIEYGYYFPFPKICFKCSVNYYKYCKKNNLYIDEIFFKDASKFIKDEELEISIKREKKNEDIKLKAKKIKTANKLNQLENYKNKTHISPEEAGLRYERYIGYLLEMQGYRVDYHGALKGKKDKGIDIIATLKNKAYIIQCKRYSNQHEVHENTINQLIGSLSTYKRKNSNYTDIRCFLYTTNNNLDKDAQETLELHFEIQHIVKPYDKDYPMVKCNIGKNQEKIYHIPNDALYDRIKIETKKGEFYCYSEQEAEKHGFRRSKN